MGCGGIEVDQAVDSSYLVCYFSTNGKTRVPAIRETEGNNPVSATLGLFTHESSETFDPAGSRHYVCSRYKQ